MRESGGVSLWWWSLGLATIACLIQVAGRPISGRHIWLRSTEGRGRWASKLRTVLRLWCAILLWVVGTP